MVERLATACRLVSSSARIVALTGAGISTESGIPDFRGPNGVWTRNPTAERLSNIHAYMSDPEVRRLSWQTRLSHPAWHAEPNAGHRALVALERAGRLRALVTQNIDGLHQQAGSEGVIELHGSIRRVKCFDHGHLADRWEDGDEVPRCSKCGSRDVLPFGVGR